VWPKCRVTPALLQRWSRRSAMDPMDEILVLQLGIPSWRCGYGSIPIIIPFLVGWTSIYQLFWCLWGVEGFDTLPYHTAKYRWNMIGLWWMVLLMVILMVINEDITWYNHLNMGMQWEYHIRYTLLGICWPWKIII
jgi:hypothetical protein